MNLWCAEIDYSDSPQAQAALKIARYYYILKLFDFLDTVSNSRSSSSSSISSSSFSCGKNGEPSWGPLAWLSGEYQTLSD